MAPRCPECGDELVAVDQPDTPPWLSQGCSRSWWQAELTPAARQAWDHTMQAHRDPDTVRAAQAEADRATAARAKAGR